jgi:ferrochelatase
MRVAVVLFNLGGPDSPRAVRPFLFNLFNDPAILSLPNPFRYLLAQLISRRRAPVARGIYEKLGGSSPLLAETNAQAVALADALAGEDEFKIFVCMRYWHPMADEAVREVAAYGPDQIVLLPLYPQFSTTTTESSLTAWRNAARAAGLDTPSRTVGCYPTTAGFIEAQADLISQTLSQVGDAPRLLLSAHGLPKKIVARGDPYQWQVEQTSAAVAAGLSARGHEDLDWQVCYQSRVGPLEWIGPSTDEEIERAGREGRSVVVAPVAFVSEHSETLVELDIEYRHLAEEKGVPDYHRVRTVGTAPAFINALADLVRAALTVPPGTVRAAAGSEPCPIEHGRCICRKGGA